MTSNKAENLNTLCISSLVLTRVNNSITSTKHHYCYHNNIYDCENHCFYHTALMLASCSQTNFCVGVRKRSGVSPIANAVLTPI